ncbi:peroxiredoxin [Komagataeibacter sucrofermentans]|uniref:thioredoxin-dependent peroxiredoxin n=1 Tax=Komagataeibacter sucrofermentans TaxID=1053551 RepID=A0A318QTM8_9PROT|nr:peroxiredoxin [Komagataeibacter sucrofermentans]PYD80731.1 peroxiredoxin [Komagataeibacter sucrofermentans]GBQ50286.1 thioredoxin peroxidase [Komagataeibacter sucrofermentans DSM 15973]
MSKASIPFPEPGSAVPDFDMPASGGRTVSLKDEKGHPFVLYFYPKANTSGCTKEACEFEAALADLQKDGVSVIGVSRDGMAAIEKFAADHALTFPLASDTDGSVTEAYGVWVEKSMYGRKYMGIERATFLVDATGHLVHAWRKVKVTNHVAAVRKAITALTLQAGAKGQ